jgi:hypothetical protein
VFIANAPSEKAAVMAQRNKRAAVRRGKSATRRKARNEDSKTNSVRGERKKESKSKNKNIRKNWCESFPNDTSYTAGYIGSSTWVDSKGTRGQGKITKGGIRKNRIVFKYHPQTVGVGQADVYSVMLDYHDASQTWSGTWEVDDPTPRDDEWIPSSSEEYKGAIETAIVWNVGTNVFINGNWNEEGIATFKMKLSRN